MRTLTWVNKVLADNDTLLCGAESAVLGTRDLEIAKERTMRFRYIRRKASNASYLRIRRGKQKRQERDSRSNGSCDCYDFVFSEIFRFFDSNERIAGLVRVAIRIVFFDFVAMKIFQPRRG